MNKRTTALVTSLLLSLSSLVSINTKQTTDQVIKYVLENDKLEEYTKEELIDIRTFFFEHRTSKSVVNSYLFNLLDSNLSPMEESVVRRFINDNKLVNNSEVSLIPENSSIGFIISNKINNNSAEIDVKFTKDGVPVVFHDESLKRATGGLFRNDISDFTYEELSKIRISYSFGNFSYIPKLEEVLNLHAESDNSLLLDIKLGPLEGVINDNLANSLKELLAKYDNKQTFMMSGNHLFLIKNYESFKKIGVKMGVVLYDKPYLRKVLLKADTDYYDFVQVNHANISSKLINHVINNDKVLFIGASSKESKETVEALFRELGVYNNFYLVTNNHENYYHLSKERRLHSKR